MCGFVIVARTALGPPVDVARLAARRDSLAHRGPDDATLEVVDDWVGLGFRRLSIIDVEGARQPLRSEDGQVVCIFNGEIYNFVELRTQLRKLGHTFATAGDGEVIVHGYEEWGTAFFARLEGMFSLALVDRRQRRTVLARDRFGIKPLFYRVDRAGLTAASEIKALLVGTVAPSASALALELGSLRMHVPWPLTAFHGIFRLPPGAVLEFGFAGDQHLSRIAPMVSSQQEAVLPAPGDALRALRTAVQRQMVADVPVGAFLSGGIDSSLIVTLMRSCTSAPLHTFSIRTLDHDESDVAARTARAIGTTHHTITLEEVAFDDLMSLPALFDEPFAETSALGVRALSRFAREHVKVALSGDGGDEVFGGYDSYRWIRATAAAPLLGRRRIGAAAHRLLTTRRWSPLARRLLRGALLLGDTPQAAQRDVMTLAWAADQRARANSEALSLRIESTAVVDASTLSPTRRAMLADRLERLPNAMLTKVDIASMSESLEVRVPMLDDELVRYADQLEIGQLVGLRHGKILLRQTLASLRGSELAWSGKRGFSLPLVRWMQNTKNARLFGELFVGHAATVHNLTGVDVVALWRAFLAGSSRFSAGTAAMQLLWFANVALWAERFGVRSADPTTVESLPIA